MFASIAFQFASKTSPAFSSRHSFCSFAFLWLKLRILAKQFSLERNLPYLNLNFRLFAVESSSVCVVSSQSEFNLACLQFNLHYLRALLACQPQASESRTERGIQRTRKARVDFRVAKSSQQSSQKSAAGFRLASENCARFCEAIFVAETQSKAAAIPETTNASKPFESRKNATVALLMRTRHKPAAQANSAKRHCQSRAYLQWRVALASQLRACLVQSLKQRTLLAFQSNDYFYLTF